MARTEGRPADTVIRFVLVRDGEELTHDVRLAGDATQDELDAARDAAWRARGWRDATDGPDDVADRRDGVTYVVDVEYLD